jgi:hypothetical protein
MTKPVEKVERYFGGDPKLPSLALWQDEVHFHLLDPSPTPVACQAPLDY